LQETLVPVDFGDSLELDEAWTFVQKKTRTRWIWCATSCLTGQVWAVQVGGRDLKTLDKLWQNLPPHKSWMFCYSDLYPVYGEFFSRQFPFWNHFPSPKGSGDTNRAEGTNTSLRAGVSYLVRRTGAFARSTFWLTVRIRYFIHFYNMRRKRKLTPPL